MKKNLAESFLKCNIATGLGCSTKNIEIKNEKIYIDGELVFGVVASDFKFTSTPWLKKRS